MTLWVFTHALFLSYIPPAVDDYLQTCAMAGRPPQKPYSGKIMLRVPPEIHARAAMIAKAHGKSLNAWVTDLLAADV
jgi:predicted HicB family RNase H-like nuclease